MKSKNNKKKLSHKHELDHIWYGRSSRSPETNETRKAFEQRHRSVLDSCSIVANDTFRAYEFKVVYSTISTSMACEHKRHILAMVNNVLRPVHKTRERTRTTELLLFLKNTRSPQKKKKMLGRVQKWSDNPWQRYMPDPMRNRTSQYGCQSWQQIIAMRGTIGRQQPHPARSSDP